jgi:lysophospholipase L1-like esterase
MRPWFWLLACLIPACGVAAAAPRVFVIGDSISLHYGPYLERQLASRFAYDRLRAEPGQGTTNLDLPDGANGGDSRRVLAYLRRRQTQGPLLPGFLLLNCGLHDIKRDPVTRALQVPLEEYTANLRAILAVAAAMQQRVVWVRTTPVVDAVHNRKPGRVLRFAADVDAYNAAADAVMRAAGIPIVDLHEFSRRFGPEAYVDHVHYRAPVREKQAAFLAEALRQIADDSQGASHPDSP